MHLCELTYINAQKVGYERKTQWRYVIVVRNAGKGRRWSKIGKRRRKKKEKRRKKKIEIKSKGKLILVGMD